MTCSPGGPPGAGSGVGFNGPAAGVLPGGFAAAGDLLVGANGLAGPNGFPLAHGSPKSAAAWAACSSVGVFRGHNTNAPIPPPPQQKSSRPAARSSDTIRTTGLFDFAGRGAGLG